MVSEVLTAEIEPVAPGGGVPTGSVTFEVITTKRKKSQTKYWARCCQRRCGDVVKPKQVLGKVITTVYSGDPNFTTSPLTPPKLSKKGRV